MILGQPGAIGSTTIDQEFSLIFPSLLHIFFSIFSSTNHQFPHNEQFPRTSSSSQHTYMPVFPQADQVYNLIAAICYMFPINIYFYATHCYAIPCEPYWPMTELQIFVFLHRYTRFVFTDRNYQSPPANQAKHRCSIKQEHCAQEATINCSQSTSLP
jgi:hypothetical protein